MKRILVLEDESSIRSCVVINLRRAGFEPVEAATGEEALEKVREYPDIRVALLDVMLPGIDGFEVCRRIRAMNSRIGIIMLSAKSQEMDKITGLSSGADDYVTKPFSTAELTARIDALCRRLGGGEDEDDGDELRQGPFALNTRNRTLKKNGERVKLTQIEYSLIYLLMPTPGRALSREEILSQVWGREYDAEEKENDLSGHGREKSLKNIDFSVKKGGSLGILGATGAGKTTIINLLMRFYDAQDGHVFVDGRDVRTYDKDELHRKFGTVFQNDTICADTIRENVSFGHQVPEAGLQRALEDAMAWGFVSEYEEGIDHESAIHGANFSGGQKQRLLIARAFAGDPEILILDDASTELDYRTDAALRQAIRQHHGEATMVVIAQRISSILSMDEILVLDEGEMIGRGTHAELMESCPLYREIYRTQMGEVA